MCVSLYIFWSMSEDKESQRKGMIGIICWPSRQEAEAPKNFAFVYSPRDVTRHIHLSNRMFDCSPIRISGILMCLPDERIFHMLKAGMVWNQVGSKYTMLRTDTVHHLEQWLLFTATCTFSLFESLSLSWNIVLKVCMGYLHTNCHHLNDSESYAIG